MQNLDSEIFRAALEAIAAEKANRRKTATARPRVSPQTEAPVPPAGFEVLPDKPCVSS